MANQPQNPTQTSLSVLRNLLFREDFSGWVVMMLVLSIPIAFGITLSSFVSSCINTFIQPFLILLFGPLQLWLIPLGGSSDRFGTAIPNGIYLGDFIMNGLQLIAQIGVLFLLAKTLKGVADRAN
jgi:hypothetical protein